ncbi:MAG: hypothetical protein V1850_05180 [Candidatus Bathyarchaeota archaeon]
MALIQSTVLRYVIPIYKASQHNEKRRPFHGTPLPTLFGKRNQDEKKVERVNRIGFVESLAAPILALTLFLVK